MDARSRLVVAAGMVTVAVLALSLHAAFGATWSNNCDPGNARFYLMHNDPIANFQPSGLVVHWENVGPDNSWLCTGATTSFIFVGGGDSVFDQANKAMVAAGWVESGVPLDGWSNWDKTSAAVHLQGLVHKDAAWVQIDLQADPLHLGASGW